jgi:hypothetical protein
MERRFGGGTITMRVVMRWCKINDENFLCRLVQ